MTSPNYYDILEVSSKASAEVIRAAYKSLMQRHHPDKNINGTESTSLASSIALAYEVIGDPQRRLAYDQMLLARQSMQAPASPYTERAAAFIARRRTAPHAATRWSAWYAPMLIFSIICAGGVILVLSNKKTPIATNSPVKAPSNSPTFPLPNEKPIALAGEGQVRTISGFVTDLSVELTPDATQLGAVHVLRIPSFGIRLSVSEPDRWMHRIQEQRPAIIQQLLFTLATARYLELIKPDGDQYLKRLIQESVTTVTGLDQSSALPMAGQPDKYTQPIEALLPVSFSVQ